MINDVEHLFMCLTDIHISSSVNYLSFAHFLIGVCSFVCLFVFTIEFFKIYSFIYLFLAVLGLRFCSRAFSSCGEWGSLFIAVHRPLTVAASLVAGHKLQTCRLSSCGSWA